MEVQITANCVRITIAPTTNPKRRKTMEEFRKWNRVKHKHLNKVGTVVYASPDLGKDYGGLYHVVWDHENDDTTEYGEDLEYLSRD